jgi:hypothetical protein
MWRLIEGHTRYCRCQSRREGHRMRTSILRFCVEATEREVPPLADFWNLAEDEIPAASGAYVLAADKWFSYPAGKSPVFYIGQARNLRKRLLTHLTFATHVRERDRRGLSMYYPRYEYAGAFGARYAFLRTWQRLSPRALEEKLMVAFARRYRAFPLANSAGAWNRLNG